MERQIQEVTAVCDSAQGIQRSPKRLWLSFDEWNVWYRARGGRFTDGQGTFAPPLLTYPIKVKGLWAGFAPFARDESVPYLDVAATLDPQNGQVCVLMLNRDLDSERELALEWRDPAPSRVLACETLTGPDLKAANTFEQPTLVVPRPLEPPRPGSAMTFKLPPRSYSVAHLATS